MPSSDETVTREVVEGLIAGMRKGSWREPFNRLCDEEPVIGGFTMAMSDSLCIRLAKLGLPPTVVAMVQREMMTAQVVAVFAMREGCRKLWADFLPDQLQPTTPPAGDTTNDCHSAADDAGGDEDDNDDKDGGSDGAGAKAGGR